MYVSDVVYRVWLRIKSEMMRDSERERGTKLLKDTNIDEERNRVKETQRDMKR